MRSLQRSAVSRIFGMVLVVAFGAPAHLWAAALSPAGIARYMAPKAPRRLALIISNGAYPSASLPAAPIDADKVAKALQTSGFDVSLAPDVSNQSDLVNKILIPFLNRVKPGDIVVIYYFGHGFSHGIDNFVMPVGASTSIPEADIYDIFLPERAIREMAAERQPGLVFLFLDACRGVIQFSNVGAPAPLVPQAPPSQNAQGDFAVGYATDYGDDAFAPSETAVSYFTDALAEKLPVPGAEFSEAQRGINAIVSKTSGYKQKAWLYSNLESLFYFVSTPQIQEGERLLWEATLQEGTRDAVTNFLRGNRASIYAGEASQWLADQDAGQIGERLTFTQVSPLSPEVLWNFNANAMAFPKLSRTLGVPRTLDLAASDDVHAFADASREELLSVAPSAIVTAKAVSVFGSDNYALTLPIGQRINISRTSNGGFAMTTLIDGTQQAITLPKSATQAGTVKVGRALAEVELDADRNLAEIVSLATIKSKLEPAITRAKAVGWVSISTPYSSNKRQQLLLSLQATFVRYQLTQIGVPEAKITVLRNDSTNKGVLRVRIFGLSPS